VLVVIAAAAVVGLAITLLPEPEKIEAPPALPIVLTEPPAPPVAAYVEKPLSLPVVRGPEAGAGMLRMPDGSFVPPLNGVVNPPAAQWTDPFSPIVGIRRSNDAGAIEWYVHADGTMTTTIMLFRHELGRTDATTKVAHPRTPVPNVDGSGAAKQD
jgi:hypothetical protein